jgi:hypothetical protein
VAQAFRPARFSTENDLGHRLKSHRQAPRVSISVLISAPQRLRQKGDPKHPAKPSHETLKFRICLQFNNLHAIATLVLKRRLLESNREAPRSLTAVL